MKREKYIDVAKGFGILLVVYAHIISKMGMPAELSVVHKCIYSFHMPLFFFISGYCLGLKKSNGEKPLFLPNLKKISQNLLLPYIIWSAVYLFVSGKFENPNYLLSVITGRGLSPLWFLIALALCELVFALLRLATYKLSKKSNTILYLGISLLLLGCGYLLWLVRITGGVSAKTSGIPLYYLFITLARFTISMPMLLFGYITSQTELIQKAGKLTSGIMGFILIGGLITIVSFTQFTTNVHLFKTNNILLLFCTSIMGSLGILMLAYALVERSKILNFLGINSLGIMILHYKPLKTMHYSNILAGLISKDIYVSSIIATIIALLISTLLVWLIKNKLFIFK